MKRIINIFLFLIVISTSIFISCKKEYSYETGTLLTGITNSTLVDSLGNCQNIIINGTYKMDSVITDSNYLKVKLTVATPGKYKIYSDTTNGFWFIDSGYVLTTGTVTVKVKAYGKPILPQATTFIIYLNSSLCTFTVNVNGISVYTASTDYFPNTINSNWTYTNNYLTNDTVRYTVSNYVGVVTGGFTYNIFVPSDTINYGNSYYRKDGSGNYYEYAYLDDSAANPVDYTFLKDNVAQGSTWSTPVVTTTFNGASTNMKYNFTIVGKNIAHTVNGTAYTNVIEVQTDVMYYIKGAYQKADTFFNYYALGIGWIDEEDLTVSPTYSFTINRYKVY